MARRSLSPLDPAARQRVADSLNQRVADTYAMYALLKTAHWNGEGPGFIGLHKFFDELASEFPERADAMSERVMGLGCPATGALPETVAKSPIAAFQPTFVSVIEYVTRVLAGYDVYDAALRATRLVSIQMGDRETAQYLDALLLDVEHDAALLVPHVSDSAGTSPSRPGTR